MGVVRLNGSFSQRILVTSGVPHVTDLGSNLFIIFINDITSLLMFASLLLFADDIKLFLKILMAADCLKLQANLAILFQWSLLNDLPVNVDECSSITFSKSSLYIVNDYVIGGASFPRVHSIKDLGILHDSSLKFDDHLDIVNLKAHNTLGFIMRNTEEFKKKRVQSLGLSAEALASFTELCIFYIYLLKSIKAK